MTKTMVKDDPHNDDSKDHALICGNQTETCNSFIPLYIAGDNLKTIQETLCKSPLNMKMLFSISWQ